MPSSRSRTKLVANVSEMKNTPKMVYAGTLCWVAVACGDAPARAGADRHAHERSGIHRPSEALPDTPLEASRRSCGGGPSVSSAAQLSSAARSSRGMRSTRTTPRSTPSTAPDGRDECRLIAGSTNSDTSPPFRPDWPAASGRVPTGSTQGHREPPRRARAPPRARRSSGAPSQVVTRSIPGVRPSSPSTRVRHRPTVVVRDERRRTVARAYRPRTPSPGRSS